MARYADADFRCHDYFRWLELPFLAGAPTSKCFRFLDADVQQRAAIIARLYYSMMTYDEAT